MNNFEHGFPESLSKIAQRLQGHDNWLASPKALVMSGHKAWKNSRVVSARPVWTGCIDVGLDRDGVFRHMAIELAPAGAKIEMVFALSQEELERCIREGARKQIGEWSPGLTPAQINMSWHLAKIESIDAIWLQAMDLVLEKDGHTCDLRIALDCAGDAAAYDQDAGPVEGGPNRAGIRIVRERPEFLAGRGGDRYVNLITFKRDMVPGGQREVFWRNSLLRQDVR